MQQKLIIALTFFLAIILQISFLPKLFFQNIAPDLVLVLVIIWSAKRKFSDIWLWIITISFFLDLISLEKVGTSGIVFLIISFMVNSLNKRFFVAQRSRIIFAVTVFVIFATVINFIYLNLMHNFSDYFLNIESINFLKIFKNNNLALKLTGNLFILAIIYWPFIRIKSFFPNRENKLIVR